MRNLYNDKLNTSILIVGGGIAGLTAAYELVENGYKNITIVEAARFGGRIQSEKLKDHNKYYERGAESINLEQTAIIELAQRLGITLIDVTVFKKKTAYTKKGFIDIQNEKVLTPELFDVQDLVLSDVHLIAAIANTSQDSLLNTTMDNYLEYLLSKGANEVGVRFISAFIENIFGADLSEVSADIAYREFLNSLLLTPPSWGDPGFKRLIIENGTERIVGALVAYLQKMNVTLYANTQVDSISLSKNGEVVSVQLNSNNSRKKVCYDKAILAVPPWMLQATGEDQREYNSHKIKILESCRIPARIFQSLQNIVPSNPAKLIFYIKGALLSGIEFNSLIFRDHILGAVALWNREQNTASNDSINIYTMYLRENKIPKNDDGSYNKEKIIERFYAIFSALGSDCQISDEIIIVLWNKETKPYIQGAYGIGDPADLDAILTYFHSSQRDIFAAGAEYNRLPGYMNSAVESAQACVECLINSLNKN
jgi:hypothetical protein